MSGPIARGSPTRPRILAAWPATRVLSDCKAASSGKTAAPPASASLSAAAFWLVSPVNGSILRLMTGMPEAS